MSDAGNNPPAITWLGPTWSKGLFTDAEGKIFMGRVYGWMCGGFIISAIAAYWIYILPALASFIVFYDKGLIFISILIVDLAFALWVSNHALNFSRAGSLFVFVIYYALGGFILSAFFSALDSNAPILMLLTVAGLFGIMSIFSYLAKADLTTLKCLTGTVLLGLIAATVINILLASAALDFTLAYVGVLVLVGLAFLNTGRLKRLFDLSATGSPGDQAIKAVNGSLITNSNASAIFVAFMFLFSNTRPNNFIVGLRLLSDPEDIGKDDAS